MSATSLTDTISPSCPAALEAGLLGLFAPSRPASRSSEGSGVDREPLWRSDAIHRALNLAQLASSLANLSSDPSRRWLTHELNAEARGLSTLYADLGTDRAHSAPVPCSEILIDVITKLILIFGRARRVTSIVSIEPMSLPPEQRRALVLICSELIINALKYAFPAGRGGNITVTFATRAQGAELVVEDDGVGCPDDYSPGQGGGLLDQLGAVMGGTISRETEQLGGGFRASLLFPLPAPATRRP